MINANTTKMTAKSNNLVEPTSTQMSLIHNTFTEDLYHRVPKPILLEMPGKKTPTANNRKTVQQDTLTSASQIK